MSKAASPAACAGGPFPVTLVFPRTSVGIGTGKRHGEARSNRSRKASQGQKPSRLPPAARVAGSSQENWSCLWKSGPGRLPPLPGWPRRVSPQSGAGGSGGTAGQVPSLTHLPGLPPHACLHSNSLSRSGHAENRRAGRLGRREVTGASRGSRDIAPYLSEGSLRRTSASRGSLKLKAIRPLEQF